MSEKDFLDQIRANQGIIYKVVSLYAADPEEKKDLYQEILLQCWKGWPLFRNDSKFSTWLYRVSLNTVFSSLRKKTMLVYQDSIPDNQALRPNSLEKEDSVALQQAIRQLTDIDRAIILLHLDGYNNGEIAQMMGISANSLSVKLYRIRQRLANILNAANRG
ncbi:RNA polymerase sigma factor [Flavihumibacter profundi]|uniref:RNA polymerase sigma factor n=1 Tax=Flavihumibacter profundi TaxID=2716883 RepID=UPI001CC5CD92|nr:sigma-70 family RNA polymerase sigma factor [Flavihumibacter profundi]MBZ5857854.1 sigma-70 family RNA polymerase sigma factor [Flavihumibacter profundi]